MRFFEREEAGRGLMLGGGYAIRVGRQVSFGLDLSWNQISIGGASNTSVVPAFTLRYHPSG